VISNYNTISARTLVPCSIALMVVFNPMRKRHDMPRITASLLTGLLAAAAVAAQQIARLKPSAFPGLPAAVRDELERRGCLIPQTHSAKGPENVISGKFWDGSSGDWAVLCSREGSSSVLVFRNGSPQSVVELDPRDDAAMVQTIGSKRELGYSRRITTAAPDRIRRRKDNRKLGPFGHDGIEDAFIEKGSVIHYLRDGKWGELRGAD